ncbi:MAG: PEPxxWA-CTERM sorting domain-containing protein [Caulobacterales bacterium]|nr:PEPxxWA-CTERM sorting domain-containing protein [Caulobacterales bacterium]
MLKKVILGAAALAPLFAATVAEAAAPKVGTVFVISLENHNFTQSFTDPNLQQLKDNPAAPYLNSLITAGNPNAALTSFASHYVNVPPQTAASPSGAGAVHPSEPNYVWAEAGVAGPRNDAQPYPNNIVNAQNLSNVLQQNGETWRSYQEGIDLAKNAGGQLTNTVVADNQKIVPLTNFSGTSADYTNPYNGGHQYNYAAKHNPQLFFTATNGGGDPTSANPMAANYAPLEQLQSDLNANTVADYNWITPDQFNDMHTSLTGGFTYNGTHYAGDAAKIAQGDNFLSLIVPMIMASQAFQNNGAIVIWNDETEGEDEAPGVFSTEIVISNLAKGNAYTNNISYDHSSDLRTMQEIFGVDPAHGIGFLGGAAQATDLGDLFKSGALGAVPEPASWALMILGFGGVGALMRRRGGLALG